MTFSASSYFGGVATVLATVVLGFGGGVLMTDALVGNSDPRPNRVAQRVVAETTISPSAVPSSEPARPENPRPAEASMQPAPSAPAQPIAPLAVMQEKPNPENVSSKSQKIDARKTPAIEKWKVERRMRAERRKQKIEEFNTEENAKVADRDRGLVERSYAAQSQPFSVFRLD